MTDEGLPRFVILHHRPGPRLRRESAPADVTEHWDWMFQVDGVLKTWATEIVSDVTVPLTIRASQLADHRLDYLDFEGDIAGDRGTVQQVVSGTFQDMEQTPQQLTAKLCWTAADQQVRSRRIEIYRNLTSICFSEETREAWELRLDLDR